MTANLCGQPSNEVVFDAAHADMANTPTRGAQPVTRQTRRPGDHRQAARRCRHGRDHVPALRTGQNPQGSGGGGTGAHHQQRVLEARDRVAVIGRLQKGSVPFSPFPYDSGYLALM